MRIFALANSDFEIILLDRIMRSTSSIQLFFQMGVYPETSPWFYFYLYQMNGLIP